MSDSWVLHDELVSGSKRKSNPSLGYFKSIFPSYLIFNGMKKFMVRRRPSPSWSKIWMVRWYPSMIRSPFVSDTRKINITLRLLCPCSNLSHPTTTYPSSRIAGLTPKLDFPYLSNILFCPQSFLLLLRSSTYLSPPSGIWSNLLLDNPDLQQDPNPGF